MLALDIHDFHLKLQNYLEQQQPRADINQTNTNKTTNGIKTHTSLLFLPV